MSKKNKTVHKEHSEPSRTTKPTAATTDSLFNSLDTWCEKRNNAILYFSIGLFLFLSIFSFDAKLSIAHDDALYIESGLRMVKEFPDFFHTANAPLYPFVLSLLYMIFGFKFILFKAFSVLFTALAIYFTHKAMQSRISAFFLAFCTLMFAINVHIIYFSHHSFTEAFYIMLQGIFFFTLFRFTDTANESGISWKGGLLCGFLIFLLVLAKTAAIGAIPAILLYALFFKRWKEGLSVGAGFAFCFGLFHLIKKTIWGKYLSTLEYSQLDVLLRKDPYKPELGNDSFSELIQRFFDNYELYISKRWFDIIGLIPDATEPKNMLGFAFLLLSLFTLYTLFKNKNKHLWHIALYSMGLTAVSFLALQKNWDQLRIILIFLPFYLILSFYGLYSFFKSRNNYVLQLLLTFIFAILIIVNINRSFKFLAANFPNTIKNFKGNKYAGYTPDWENYIKMSEWIGENLKSDSVLVACRKPPVSFVHSGGKLFAGIYTIPSEDADSLVMNLHEKKVTHVMVANLRRNPNKKDGYIINTVHRYLNTIQQKYPNFLTPVHRIGNSEEVNLFKINYPEIPNKPDSVATKEEIQGEENK
ncbi:MAG: hypothetical protein HUU48_07000 [Flavobacteriales bacterium]|nr:hypothetical protein [Flavobacteriales bacterium]